MSIATTAGAKALFGDMMSPQQKIAANTPATAAAAKFAEYLAEDRPLRPANDARTSPAPSPELLAKALLGDTYDPSTGSVRLDKVAGATQRHTAEFAQLLRQKLATANVDPKHPVALSVGADGRVIVDGSHPHADAIARLFEEEPALAQAYRSVAARNDHLAILQAGAAYVAEWRAAGTDSERQAAWQRSTALMDRLSNLFGGRMAFAGETAIAESPQIQRRMGFA